MDQVETAAPETTPAAGQVAPEAPKLSPFAQRIADLREEKLADAAPPAPAPEAAAEVVPEAGEPSGKVEESSAAPPAEEPGEAVAIVAKLPGRRPDDPDFDLPLDKAALEALGITPEEALDRVAQLRNMGMRRAELVTQLEAVNADRAELDSFEEALRTDPGGFLSERVPEPVQEAVAEKLLKRLSPEAWDRLMEKCAAWDKAPEKRSTEHVREENERLRAEQKRRDEVATRRAESAEVKSIGTAIADLIPDDMGQAKGDRFFDYAIQQLQRHIEKHGIKTLDPTEVPQILADLGVLQDFGLSVAEKPTTVPPAKTAPPKGAAAPARTQTGEDLKKRVETRKAAATAPAGAGSGTSGRPPLPKGHTWDQKKAWLKDRLGI